MGPGNERHGKAIPGSDFFTCVFRAGPQLFFSSLALEVAVILSFQHKPRMRDEITNLARQEHHTLIHSSHPSVFLVHLTLQNQVEYVL
jgi:hypothetical protein